MLVENSSPRPLDVWKKHVLEPFEVENNLEAYVAGLSKKDQRSLRKTIRSECSAVRDQEKPRQKDDCTLWNEAIDWRNN